jgi:hypothetical protein
MARQLQSPDSWRARAGQSPTTKIAAAAAARVVDAVSKNSY